MAMDGLASSKSKECLQTLLRTLWGLFDTTCVAFSAIAGWNITPRLLVASNHFWDDEYTAFQIQACRAFLDHDLKRNPLPEYYNPRVDHASSNTDLASRFGYQYKEIVEGMRFFKTQTGSLGLGPAIAQKGDAIVLFGDMRRFTFLLRPVGTLWRLVGACYV
jgi:hypothetical protein